MPEELKGESEQGIGNEKEANILVEQRRLQTGLELISLYSIKSERRRTKYRVWCWLGM